MEVKNRGIYTCMQFCNHFVSRNVLFASATPPADTVTIVSLMHIGHRSLSIKNQKCRKCRIRADSWTLMVRNLVVCKNSHFIQIILVVRLLDLEIRSPFCVHTNLLGISQMLESVRLFFVGYELALFCCSLRDVRIYKTKYKTVIIISFALISWCAGRCDRTRNPSNFSMFLGNEVIVTNHVWQGIS